MDMIAIADPAGIVQPTRLTHKLVVDGRSQAYPVYRIRLDLLRYNRHNGRVSTWVGKYRAEHDGIFPAEGDQDEYNRVMEQLVVASNEDAMRRTANNIRLLEQRVPAVVLSDGLIVDGNRRFTCLRMLSCVEPRFGWMEAVVLPQAVDDDPRRVKLLEFAIQHGEEDKVGYDPIDRLAGAYNDIVRERLLTVEEYARASGLSAREVGSMVRVAGYAAEFLDFLDCPGQFHLVRELDVYDAFRELPSLMRHCADEQEGYTARQVFYANLAVEPLRSTKAIAKRFSRIMASPSRRDFLEEEVRLAARAVDVLARVPSVTPAFVRDVLRGDPELADGFAQALLAADAKARGRQVLEGSPEHLKRALTQLERVNLALLAHLPAEDVLGARQTLDALARRVDEIRSVLDGAESS